MRSMVEGGVAHRQWHRPCTEKEESPEAHSVTVERVEELLADRGGFLRR